MLAIRILFCSYLCKVRSQIFDALSQALCNLSLAFLADFTLSDSTALIRFIAFSHTLLFLWIERHDHRVHMSSILQAQQLYTAGIPLLEAYLLPMANNRTRNERLSKNKTAASHAVKIHTHARFPRSEKWPTYHVAVCRTNRKRSSFATKHFQRKSLKIFDLHPPPRRLVSFVARINA